MICVSIQNHSFEEILKILEDSVPPVRMAEIRLDRCDLGEEQISELFSSSDTPLVATCRVAGDGRGSWVEAERKLMVAIEAGAAFADLEIEAPKEMGKRIRRACDEFGVTLIRSCHFFDGMPSSEVLLETARKCRRFGGEIIKVVALASSPEEAARILSLYDCPDDGLDPDRLVAFAMGEAGRETRLECLRKGAPFTYAALSEEEGAAPGQWPYALMTGAVYGGRVFPDGANVLQMPSSKSFAQRAIVAAALAAATFPGRGVVEGQTGLVGKRPPAPCASRPSRVNGRPGALPTSLEGCAPGRSVLRGYSPCGDNEAALQVARALGAEVKIGAEGDLMIASSPTSSMLDGKRPPAPCASRPSRVTDTKPSEVELVSLPRCEGGNRKVNGRPGALPSSQQEDDMSIIHVGESGLLTRLMIPIVAALEPSGREVRITGEGTLLGRPLKGASEIMARFGTVLRPESPQGGGAVKVPLTVQGPLLPGKADISGRDGSQLISGLMMALPLLPEDSTVHVHDPRSIPYMFITADVLRKFGIRIGSEMEGDEEFLQSQDWSHCTGITFKIKGGQEYSPATFDIEGDWSAAANFLVAGAVFGKVRLQGIDTKSLQADISIMDVLMEAGASLSRMEDSGIITAQRSPLRPFSTDLNNCPDLFPIVAVLAAFCGGRSDIQGFKRLAGKESDRGKAIVQMLTRMGVQTLVEGDTLSVFGMTLERRLLTGNLLKGGEYSSSHDHRMAMALSVASLGADGPVVIDDTACVAKSFPGFFDTWRKI